MSDDYWTRRGRSQLAVTTTTHGEQVEHRSAPSASMSRTSPVQVLSALWAPSSSWSVYSASSPESPATSVITASWAGTLTPSCSGSSR